MNRKWTVPRAWTMWGATLLSCICSNHAHATPPRVLVVGGSGRVGGSALRALHFLSRQEQSGASDVQLFCGSRSIETYREATQRMRTKFGMEDYPPFVAMDATNKRDLQRLLPDFDLVINTAGPFQSQERPLLLEACVERGLKYLDVCDDVDLSRKCRALSTQAGSTGSLGIISVGIWPGVSSLIAAELVDKIGVDRVSDVTFSFFTAGSGGAGPTILSATFLILAEEALVYRGGGAVRLQAASDFTKVDFGPYLGRRTVFRMNLIETESCHASRGVPNVQAFFGTAPDSWNYLLSAVSRLPKSILRSRDLMQGFGSISLPLVRVIDTFVGSANGIRVDVTDTDGKVATAICAHRDLEECVGDSIAAFAVELLKQHPNMAPGVYFPEEVPSKEYREAVLRRAQATAVTWILA